MENANGSGEVAAVGNTRTTADIIERCSASVKWCMTWNNYPDDWKDKLLGRIGSVGSKFYIFGKEVGDSGTPHIQGFIYFAKKVRPIETIKIKEIHWEKAKGNVKENYIYCSKGNDFIQQGFTRQWIVNNGLDKIKIIENLYSWQELIIEEYRKHQVDGDDRHIYWIYDSEGNKGKTAFCKYLIVKEDMGFLKSGKSADIAFYCKEHKRDGYCINLSRSAAEVMNYDAIESLKDGLMFSGKYESSSIVMNCPFVCILANWEPDYKQLSKDRWRVMNIDACNEYFIKDLDGNIVNRKKNKDKKEYLIDDMFEL